MQNYILPTNGRLQKTAGSGRSRFSFNLSELSIRGLVTVILLFANNAFADTYWLGGISNDWHTAGNWTAGVPDASDVAEIQAASLPNVNPIITGAAVAKTVIVAYGGFLTIAVDGTLSIADSQGHGLDVYSGSVENNGTLNINNVAYTGIGMSDGLFTNNGTINIGNAGDIGYAGIDSDASTFVNESGSISINRTCKAATNCGAMTNTGSGSFTNKASITIGGVMPGLYDGRGLWCADESVFFNEAGGLISISRTVSDGLYNGATFTNQGSIDIGAAGDIGGDAIFNRGYFDNTASTAYINIASDNIINNNLSGEFYNGGVIIENASGNSKITQNTGVVQNLNGGSFLIPSGPAAITATGQIWTGFSDAEWNNPSNWQNSLVPTATDDVTIAHVATDLVVGSINAVAKSVTVQHDATLTIGNSGILTISGGAFQGLLNKGTVVNNGLLKIGLITSPGSYGIRNEGTFNNSSGAISIDNATQAALYNFSGTFTNSASMSLKTAIAAPFLIHSNGGAISNAATGTLSGTGVINPTHFSNNGGILSPGYSPGVMTFNGDENFSASTLAVEVNGTGVAGTAYDQVVVNGTATLEGTLDLTFNFPSPVTGDVVKILDATALSGTFSVVTGLPDGWTINYDRPNPGELSLAYQVILPVTMIRFTAKKLDSGIKLDWQTSEETNNKGFEIERRLDSGMWEKVGFVDGNGTTRENNTYSFLDLRPLPGMNYYRLRQMDFDGKVELSRIVGVKMDSGKMLKIYPNPTTGIVNIEGGGSRVRILDKLGRPVMSGMIINQKIDVSHLPSGFYILSVPSESNVKSISMIKQ
ncbi:T9SS type A sorting domain-containing protein [Dyadobacter aurulentus]|uniref:T9SS type A sorting domain-containing protein n=1 Tax=Dyadobacter sp. UC 10 TaxID=2605428 RepID=UPI0011F23C38|nr:T9SS type A sorting domain-containing protein [Dyadobacter sp. UC 10]KAA0988913.1 T9SS type A sorting domain-containing protein [Dyadobacter sp. UC 10]